MSIFRTTFCKFLCNGGRGCRIYYGTLLKFYNKPIYKDKVLGFEYSKEPKMGYSVVDFDLKPNSTEIKSYHFGSPVSKMESQIPKEEVSRFFPSQK